jgi:hypothetical protein
MNKIAIILTSIIAVSSCAMTYKKPSTKAQAYTFQTSSVSETLERVKFLLLKDGYSISSSGVDFISTTTKPVKLTPLDADCGTTMGIDYLKDNRTVTKVSISVFKNSKSELEIKANITGEYLTSNTSQSVSMSCVSKGTLEKNMISSI